MVTNVNNIKDFVWKIFSEIFAFIIINSKKNILTATVTPEDSEKTTSGRVDINNLIARVRLEKQKENKINLIFFGLIIALVVVVGTILSF